jgi:hypothetical protein
MRNWKLDKEFESSYDNTDEKIHKVINEEEYDKFDSDEEMKKSICRIGIGTALVLCALGYYYVANKSDKTNEEQISNDSEIIEDTETVIQPTIEEEIASTIEATNTTATFDFSDEELDYSNADTFFNQIVEYRNKYGEFAESFQSKEDVINFVNFLNMFDETQKGIESTINSQAMFDEIIADYYKSCVEHDIEPSLSSLIPEGTYMRTIMEEGEKLSYNLKNFNGSKDYESANDLYNYIVKNFLDTRTAIPQYNKYVVYIDWAREQYEQYRNTANMINARKYQKNHTLDADGIDLYYGYNGQDIIDNGGTYEIKENGLYCPDAVDNLFSKSENIEETKWISSYDGTIPFQKVNEGFEDILRKRSR